MWAVFLTILGLLSVGLFVMWSEEDVSQETQPSTRASHAASAASTGQPPRPSDTPRLPEPDSEVVPTTGLVVDAARSKQVVESIPVKSRAPKTG